MKEQGECGEILFTASLRDGLAGTVSEAITKTSFAGNLRLGVDCRDLFYLCRRRQLHMTLKKMLCSSVTQKIGRWREIRRAT